MHMLTQDDLKAIGALIKAEIGPVDGKIDTIAARIDSLEESMNVKFDAVHEEFETLKNTVVTKSYLDEKLAFYVKRPF